MRKFNIKYKDYPKINKEDLFFDSLLVINKIYKYLGTGNEKNIDFW